MVLAGGSGWGEEQTPSLQAGLSEVPKLHQLLPGLW